MQAPLPSDDLAESFSPADLEDLKLHEAGLKILGFKKAIYFRGMTGEHDWYAAAIFRGTNGSYYLPVAPRHSKEAARKALITLIQSIAKSMTETNHKIPASRAMTPSEEYKIKDECKLEDDLDKEASGAHSWHISSINLARWMEISSDNAALREHFMNAPSAHADAKHIIDQCNKRAVVTSQIRSGHISLEKLVSALIRDHPEEVTSLSTSRLTSLCLDLRLATMLVYTCVRLRSVSWSSDTRRMNLTLDVICDELRRRDLSSPIERLCFANSDSYNQESARSTNALTPLADIYPELAQRILNAGLLEKNIQSQADYAVHEAAALSKIVAVCGNIPTAIVSRARVASVLASHSYARDKTERAIQYLTIVEDAISDMTASLDQLTSEGGDGIRVATVKCRYLMEDAVLRACDVFAALGLWARAEQLLLNSIDCPAPQITDGNRQLVKLASKIRHRLSRGGNQ
jgi:hypothetical protein